MNSDIFDKLKKILALAERGGTQAEMEVAMAKAQELASKHNIELGEVMAQRSEDDQADVIETDRADISFRAGTKKPEHTYIVQVLMTCFEVRAVYVGNYKLVFIGEKTDVQLAQFCFKFLESQFSKLMRRYVASVGGSGYGNKNQQHSFYTGLASGISAVNRRIREEAKASNESMALVLVKKEEAVNKRAAEEFPCLRKAKKSNYEVDYNALTNGISAGKSIKLNHQIS
jgi:hypothetical protein